MVQHYIWLNCDKIYKIRFLFLLKYHEHQFHSTVFFCYWGYNIHLVTLCISIDQNVWSKKVKTCQDTFEMNRRMDRFLGALPSIHKWAVVDDTQGWSHCETLIAIWAEVNSVIVSYSVRIVLWIYINFVEKHLCDLVLIGLCIPNQTHESSFIFCCHLNACKRDISMQSNDFSSTQMAI